SVASRIGDCPARRKGRSEVAVHDGDEAAEFPGRALRGVGDVESDDHCSLLGAYLPRRMGSRTSCYGPHYTDRGTDVNTGNVISVTKPDRPERFFLRHQPSGSDDSDVPQHPRAG